MSVFRRVEESCAGHDVGTDDGFPVLLAAVNALSDEERTAYSRELSVVEEIVMEVKDWGLAIDLMEERLYGEAS